MDCQPAPILGPAHFVARCCEGRVLHWYYRCGGPVPFMWNILQGDVREKLAALPEKHFHCCVTSPPFWQLRDYKVDGQIGLEPTPQEYVAKMVDVCRSIHLHLRDDGVFFLNIGDTYSARGHAGGGNASPHQFTGERGWRSCPPGWKKKELIPISWLLGLALQADGWYLRQACIWSKPNCLGQPHRDRFVTSHEYVLILTKKPHYYFDYVAVMEQGASKGRDPGARKPREGVDVKGGNQGRGQVPNALNRRGRSVWTIPVYSSRLKHYAGFPPRLAERCILAGTSEKGCCPECGKPWVRLTEKRRVATRPAHESKVYVDPEGSPYEKHNGSIVGNRDPERHITEVVTTGWEPGCKCGHDPVPCRVLDPFSGAGTTCMVAERLGRDSVGIDLKPEYVEMANKRIAEDIEKRRAVTPKRADEPLPLFEGDWYREVSP